MSWKKAKKVKKAVFLRLVPNIVISRLPTFSARWTFAKFSLTKEDNFLTNNWMVRSRFLKYKKTVENMKSSRKNRNINAR